MSHFKTLGKENGYCTKVWNRRDHRASEMSHHQPHQGWSSCKAEVMYGVGLKESSELLLGNHMIRSNKYCSQ